MVKDSMIYQGRDLHSSIMRLPVPPLDLCPALPPACLWPPFWWVAWVDCGVDGCMDGP